MRFVYLMSALSFLLAQDCIREAAASSDGANDSEDKVYYISEYLAYYPSCADEVLGPMDRDIHSSELDSFNIDDYIRTDSDDDYNGRASKRRRTGENSYVGTRDGDEEQVATFSLPIQSSVQDGHLTGQNSTAQAAYEAPIKNQAHVGMQSAHGHSGLFQQAQITSSIPLSEYAAALNAASLCARGAGFNNYYVPQQTSLYPQALYYTEKGVSSQAGLQPQPWNRAVNAEGESVSISSKIDPYLFSPPRYTVLEISNALNITYSRVYHNIKNRNVDHMVNLGKGRKRKTVQKKDV